MKKLNQYQKLLLFDLQKFNLLNYIDLQTLIDLQLFSLLISIDLALKEIMVRIYFYFPSIFITIMVLKIN